jgi:tRNA nucleotidyltransferase/poly(A) polymerase
VFTDSLEEDSKRRDFTCNAVYFDVEKEEFIDPT